jgi:hypothetical protein
MRHLICWTSKKEMTSITPLQKSSNSERYTLSLEPFRICISCHVMAYYHLFDLQMGFYQVAVVLQ